MAATRALRQTILRPHETLAELAEHEPADAYAVGAFVGDELVAVGFIAPDGDPGGWRIRGMATDPAARGRGAGTAILRTLIDHGVERGATRVWCNARTPARSLYERAGMRIVSAEFELPAIGPHFVMELRPASESSPPAHDPH
jgi:ribosomal protein S18 acetylase RimI-like enzyme